MGQACGNLPARAIIVDLYSASHRPIAFAPSIAVRISLSLVALHSADGSAAVAAQAQ